MQAKTKRNINTTREYDDLFPKPIGKTVVIKKVASVDDTLEFMPKVVSETLVDTVAISKMLKGKNDYETCSNIWDFVYKHIQYRHDEFGQEQVRRPARAWMDRHRGVDCDCYTVFKSSILSNLSIPHLYRVTKYEQSYFQHVYPVALPSKREEIIIDCVTNQFNYEVPYSEKYDRPMELQYLNGFDSQENEENETFDTDELSLDATDLVEGSDDLGFLKKFRRKFKNSRFGKKLKKVASKALHVVNRINPAAALLRMGVLVAMKINMFKVAAKLRWAYVSESEAKRQGLDLGKWSKVKRILQKLEKIFFGAGGKPKNLKKAILKGKGNRDRSVPLSGLGETDTLDYNENSSLLEILGPEIYHDEIESVDGLGQLGVVATGASLTAATGVLASIAKLLNSLGNMMSGKKRRADQGATAAADNKSIAPRIPSDESFDVIPLPSSSLVPDTTRQDPNDPDSDPNADNDDGNKRGIVDKAKDWVKEHPIKTGMIGLGVVGTVVGGVALKSYMNKKEEETKAKAKSKEKGLSGAKQKKGKGKSNKPNNKGKNPSGTRKYRKKTTTKAAKIELL
ncbi:MAG: hypothetical protein JKX76_02940 [Colwellia sp.]|nr:hypothetical protein [Colwellia sp.]